MEEKDWGQIKRWFTDITHQIYDAWGVLNELKFAESEVSGVQAGIAIGEAMQRFDSVFDELSSFEEFLGRFPDDDTVVYVSASCSDVGSPTE